MSWADLLRAESECGPILWDVSLKPYSYLAVGGTARALAKPQTLAQLQALLQFCAKHGVPFKPFGAASNILFSDQDLNIVFISLAQMEQTWLFEEEFVTLWGDIRLDKFLNRLCQKNLGGLECLMGIPGTVCGSLFNNAGTAQGAIGDFVTHFFYVDRAGQVRECVVDQDSFAYRRGPLRAGEGVLCGLRLKAQTMSQDEIRQRNQTQLRYRKETQPLKEYSLGCMFKNPRPDLSASWLIDQSGLKSLRIGEVEVSAKHANFFTHAGHAKADDYYALIEVVRQKVYDKFQVYLELEVQLMGEFR